MNNSFQYFLLAVSTKENLELCKKYSLAGFPESMNGAWTFCDIQEGNRVSFLYGARVHNLYEVEEKFCLENAKTAPPWGLLKFRSGLTYSFPFRFKLKPLREFDEPLTREEFAYVAENLLLRGGYRKTHFQADRTNLSYVSTLGNVFNGKAEELIYSNPRFELKFTFNEKQSKPPKIFAIREPIIQAAIRHYLSNERNLQRLLKELAINFGSSSGLEVLGEKALPQGYVDILIKEAMPTGLSKKVIIEVKKGKANRRDFEQLETYWKELGQECIDAVLIANKVNDKVKRKYPNIKVAEYSIDSLNDTFTFQELVRNISLTPK